MVHDVHGARSLTPRIVRQAYAWLTIVEDYNHPKHNEFQAKLKDGAWTALATEVRETFLLFCSRTPELASQYVKSFEGRKHAERSILQLLKFRGSLAQAAPKELADATIRALIPPEADPDDNHGPGMKGHSASRTINFIRYRRRRGHSMTSCLRPR